MPIKGYGKFREKLPAFSGKKIAFLPVFVTSMGAIAFTVFLIFDSLPGTLSTEGTNGFLLSLFPLFGVLIIEVMGLVLVWQIWFWRDRLKAKYGATAYQRIFLVGFGGIAWILTVAVNQYLPYYLFAPAFWGTSPLQVLAMPMDTFLGSGSSLVFVLKEAIAVVCLVTGVLISTRALHTFGIDYMVVLYLYFPKESKVQQNEIYSVLRHPTYAGAILICLGGAFFTFTLLSFAAFAIFLLGFYVHVYFVEERELIERFGEAYRNYRRKTPAFFVRPKSLGTLLRFLIGEKTNNYVQASVRIKVANGYP